MHEELHGRSKLWIPYTMINSSQFVHEFGQSIKDYSALHPNWKDDFSWSLGWFSHGEHINMYVYISDKTYYES